MLQWASRAALDIIGVAGFNYDLDTLHQGIDGSELASALRQITNPKNFPPLLFFKLHIPPLRVITFDRQSKGARHTRGTLQKIGVNIIEKKERELEREKGDQEGDLKMNEPGGYSMRQYMCDDSNGTTGMEKDLLSSIVRLNMTTLSTGTKALSMEQMTQQIPAFIVAGEPSV